MQCCLGVSLVVLKWSCLEVEELSFCHSREAFCFLSSCCLMPSSFSSNQSWWTLSFGPIMDVTDSFTSDLNLPHFSVVLPSNGPGMSACHVYCSSVLLLWRMVWWSSAFCSVLGQCAFSEIILDQMMVIPAFSSTHGFGDLHIMDVSPATNGIVSQMALLGSGVHSCCFVLVSLCEERFSYCQVICAHRLRP